MRPWLIMSCFIGVHVVVSEKVEVDWNPETGVLVFEGVTYTQYFEPVAASAIRRKTATYAFHVFCTIICIVFAALAAGLTMGLVSLEPFDMKILMEANEDDCTTDGEKEELRREQAYAKRLYPLVSRHHLLLVTLLLLNSIANEALPLFLNEIVPPVLAVVISVTAVLIFGEILPSAIFTGPNQLAIGAAMSPLVWFLIYAFWIVAYPISLVLDKMLGEEHKGRYNKAEFRALINLHNEESEEYSVQREGTDEETGLAGLRAELGAKQILNRSGVAKQELRIMTGALELHRLRVKDVMLPLDEVFMLSTQAKLDTETLTNIVMQGHSRIPVFEGHPHNIRGMLLVKRLVVLNPEDRRQVGSLSLLEPLVVNAECTLLDLLYEFSMGKSHLAIITSDPGRVVSALRSHETIPVNVHMAGIVTLEDIIERLIKHDIQDESDMSIRSYDNVVRPFERQVVEYLPSDSGSMEDFEYYGKSTVRLTPPYSTNKNDHRPVSEDLKAISGLDLENAPARLPTCPSPVLSHPYVLRNRTPTPATPGQQQSSSLSVPLLLKTP